MRVFIPLSNGGSMNPLTVEQMDRNSSVSCSWTVIRIAQFWPPTCCLAGQPVHEADDIASGIAAVHIHKAGIIRGKLAALRMKLIHGLLICKSGRGEAPDSVCLALTVYQHCTLFHFLIFLVAFVGVLFPGRQTGRAGT